MSMALGVQRFTAILAAVPVAVSCLQATGRSAKTMDFFPSAVYHRRINPECCRQPSEMVILAPKAQ